MSARNTTKFRALNLEHPMHNGPIHELITITPELASEWLGKNHGNRNQRSRAIAAYARDMMSDAWLYTGDPIRFDWDGRLIDGQHRLEAIVQTGASVLTLVIRNLDPRVQGVIDANAKRSASDALKFAGVSVQTRDIAAIARIATAYEAGLLKTALDNANSHAITNTEVVRWHAANPDVEQAAAFANRFARPIGATSSAIGFAVLLMSRIDVDQTIEFFSAAAEMRTDGTGDPRKAMLDAFTKIRNDRRTPTPAETLAIVFRAWNNWREGRSLKLIKNAASNGRGGVTGVQIVEPK